MRGNQSKAVVLVMAASFGGCMAHGCAEATGVSVSKSIWWEIDEFWRKTVLPLWTWEENEKADEGDVPELACPATSSHASSIPLRKACRVLEKASSHDLFTEPLAIK